MADHNPLSRRWLKRLIPLGILALVAWGVRRTIVSAMDELSDFDWSLDLGWLLVAALLYLLGLLPMGVFWYRVLRALGQHPGKFATLRAFYIGHLGKYVPGKAMVVILRAGLLRSERVDTPVAAASVFIETLTMMAVGAFLAAATLTAAMRDRLGEHAYFIPLAIGLMICSGLPTLPPVFQRLVRMLGIGRKDPNIDTKLQGYTYGVMATGWVLVGVGWIFLTLSLYAVLRGIGLEGVEVVGHFHYFLASTTLAMVAGFLSLIPGGAGVRELILTAILGRMYFAEVLHLPLAAATALAAALLLRLVWLGAELVVASLFARFRNKATTQTAGTN